MRATLLLLVTTLAFLASLFVVPPAAVVASKRGEAAIGAARLGMVQAAKPIVRKAERTPGPAITPRVFAALPTVVASSLVKTPRPIWIPSAPHRSLLMVFLN